MIMNERMQSVCANRREFLRGSLRHALLAGLAAVSVVLVKRRGTSLPSQTCINQGICRGCGAFEDCGLPQALSAKRVAASRQSAAVILSENQVGGVLPKRRYEKAEARHEA
jgi:hypothetical protein